MHKKKNREERDVKAYWEQERQKQNKQKKGKRKGGKASPKHVPLVFLHGLIIKLHALPLHACNLEEAKSKDLQHEAWRVKGKFQLGV